MLATMQTSPLDNLLAKIQAFLDDKEQPGFGTLITTEDGVEADVSFKPNEGENFRDFVDRVRRYAKGAPIEWHIQGRKVPLARVRRPLS